MDSQFSPRIKDIIGYSREEAIRLGNDYIGQEHLFLGILRDGEGIATDILENLGIDLAEVKQLVEKKIKSDKSIQLWLIFSVMGFELVAVLILAFFI